MTENQIREIIVAAGKELVERQLVQGTWGNISVRVDADTMLVTPSGVDYGRMKEEDLVLMNIHTLEYVGDRKPSSEKDIHAALLRQRPAINAVIHSHPSYCSSIAAARMEIPVRDPKGKELVGETIRIANYSLPSTKWLMTSAIEAMQDRNACILANHGVIAAGKDLDQAFEVISYMEQACKEYIQDAVKEQTSSDKFELEKMFELFLNIKK
ncbi:MAG: class II aldolase/adducin family protein [Bacillota bacterium]|jgi:L-fuculose-phosphate aldolase|nr:class II aldolase/adducin family protein [Bacillota bacterium]HHU42770.1 class II aldolase/adducin family protein [Clostridiales bacterium]